MRGDVLKSDRPFNMDQITLERLNDKLNVANIAAIEGDVDKWFRALREVWANTEFKYNEDKDKEGVTPSERIEGKLNIIAEELSKRPTSRQNANQFFTMQTKNIEKKLIELEKDLMRVLYRYNLIYLKDNTTTWQEKMDEDYS